MNALPQTKTVRLAGKDYVVKELTIGDLADLQDAGVDFEKIKAGARPSIRDMGRILWVKVRRRGSETEPWRPSLEHLLHNCTPEEFNAAVSTAMETDSAPLPQQPEPSTG